MGYAMDSEVIGPSFSVLEGELRGIVKSNVRPHLFLVDLDGRARGGLRI
jgi:hypothetical protein